MCCNKYRLCCQINITHSLQIQDTATPNTTSLLLFLSLKQHISKHGDQWMWIYQQIAINATLSKAALQYHSLSILQMIQWLFIHDPRKISYFLLNKERKYQGHELSLKAAISQKLIKIILKAMIDFLSTITLSVIHYLLRGRRNFLNFFLKVL